MASRGGNNFVYIAFFYVTCGYLLAQSGAVLLRGSGQVVTERYRVIGLLGLKLTESHNQESAVHNNRTNCYKQHGNNASTPTTTTKQTPKYNANLK
jgi:hypothetical protein